MKNILIFQFLILFFLQGCGTSSSQTDEPLNIMIEPYSIRMLDENFSFYDQSLWEKSDWANGDPFYNGWCPEQVDINNSLLILSLDKQQCHNRQYASGEYRTKKSYMYGIYSARFQASDKNGTITSFFTYTGPAEGTQWDEIDIEILGKDPTKMQVNYWRNSHEHPYSIDLGFDASKALHTYSFVFTKESIKWYVDDKFVYSVEENHLENEDSLPCNGGKIMVNFWAAKGIEKWSGTFEENTTASVIYDFITFDALE